MSIRSCPAGRTPQHAWSARGRDRCSGRGLRSCPECLFQRPQLGGQCRHLLFKTRYTNGQRLADRCPVARFHKSLRFDDGSAEGMPPARLLLARTARQLADQRRLVRHTLQRLLHLAHRVEAVQAIAASAELAGSLRAAQEEEREHGLRRALELPARIEVVIPPHGPAAEDLPDQLLILQAVEGALNLALPQLHHRLAIRLLVRGRDERVEREGVVLCRGQRLFDQATHHPTLAPLLPPTRLYPPPRPTTHHPS